MGLARCIFFIMHSGKEWNSTGKNVKHLQLMCIIFFKSGARREDFRNIQSTMEAVENQFLKHVTCRWLTLVPAFERLIEQHEPLLAYLKDLPKTVKNIDTNSRYKDIADKLKVRTT